MAVQRRIDIDIGHILIEETCFPQTAIALAPKTEAHYGDVDWIRKVLNHQLTNTLHSKADDVKRAIELRLTEKNIDFTEHFDTEIELLRECEEVAKTHPGFWTGRVCEVGAAPGFTVQGDCKECGSGDDGVYDIRRVVSGLGSDGETLGYMLAVALGGPTIWIDTFRELVTGTWGFTQVEVEYNPAFTRILNNYYNGMLEGR